MYYIGCSERHTEHLERGEKMAKLKVQRVFDEFLLDPNLSLRAKGFLTMVLTNNITHGIEIKEHCTDSMEDIKDTLLELRINKYIRYNSELNILEANAVPYTNGMKKKKNYKRKEVIMYDIISNTKTNC